MIIDIMTLKQNIVQSLEVNEEVNISKDDLKEVSIIEIKNLRVSGYIYRNEIDDYDLDLKLEGILVLPCSVTLEPIDYKISTLISGNYNEMMEEIGEITKKSNNSLDILPIIWENMLMEIPIKVTGPEATDLKLSGDGWKLVTEESENKELEAASPFDKLKGLL